MSQNTAKEKLSNISYNELREKALKCTKCKLSKTRTKVVFGHGPVPCDLMLIGEGPGEKEDVSGLPFVGRAGKLLTTLLRSIKIDREKNIYITNIVKCRPPNNRAPKNEETLACYPYLKAQIKLIKPKIILTVGSSSAKVLLNNEEPMTTIRGKWARFNESDIYVLPIFHPSYLLRNPSNKQGSPKWITLEDLKEVQRALKFIHSGELVADMEPEAKRLGSAGKELGSRDV